MNEIPETDPAFIPYIERFRSECGVNTDGVPVTFEAPPAPSVGICYTFADGYKEINIYRPYWDISPPGRKLWLIYHELGHCILNRDHAAGINEEYGTIQSIMNPTVPWEAEYLLNKNYNYYILELCGNL